MNPRVEAISVLQQARDMLAERLTQRVLDSRQEILDDAEGATYLSEIEAVYEQLGGRLAHINTMLSHLPPVEDVGPDQATGEPVFTDVRTTYDSSYELDMPVISLPLALPAPAVTEERPQLTVAPSSLQSFVLYIQTGDIETAARCLAELFDLPPGRDRICIDAFLQRWAAQPDLIHRVLAMKYELQAGNINPSLTILSDCFGLHGMESISAVQSLRKRLGLSNS